MNIKQIPKIRLGRTGLDISRAAYGGIISMNEKQEDSDRYVEEAIDYGVNYFDVAPSYGNAQEILGKSLIGKRNNVYLACKTGEFEVGAGKAQFQESLEMLHTDHFDVYQLHGLTTDEQLERAFSPNGIMNFLVTAKEEGTIRNLGFSAHNETIALKALSLYDFDTVLFPFNWSMNMEMQAGNRLLDAAKERNMGILALKVMAHRAFAEGEADKYPKSWYKPIDLDDLNFISAAVNYSISLGIHTIVPPGYYEYLKLLAENFEKFADQRNIEESIEYLKNILNTRDTEILPNIL